jgi:hypothetical protein
MPVPFTRLLINPTSGVNVTDLDLFILIDSATTLESTMQSDWMEGFQAGAVPVTEASSISGDAIKRLIEDWMLIFCAKDS